MSDNETLAVDGEISGTVREHQHTDASSRENGHDTADVTTTPDSRRLFEEMRSLSALEKIGYGFGHIFNDLCAGVWFSYTLLFLQGALRIPAKEAGILVMLGQVGDALATPIVGILTDKYGSKRLWHIGGTALVFFSFPLIFSMCPWCETLPKWWEPMYFTICILLFQLGWAIVQITHLAMIPELSRTLSDRSDLTAIRYSASICSNVVVYIVTWAVLHNRDKDDNNIGPGDAFRFRDISLILTLAGISMTVLFHFSLSVSNYDIRRRLQPLSESHIQHNTTITSSSDSSIPSTSSSSEPDETTALLKPDTPKRRITNGRFLRSPLLYQNTFLYVFSRLFMTTSLIYMPLWLDERAYTPQDPQENGSILIEEETNVVEHIATVPLVSFLASFVSSVVIKYCSRLSGHQFSYFVGSVLCVGGCISVYYVSVSTSALAELFGVAILFGAGSSITMISSLCITADMIGSHTQNGGFIYSAVTFFDKLITGIVVAVIEAIKCHKRDDCPQYYRDVLAYGCGTACVLGICILLTLQCTKRSRRLIQ